MLCTPSYSYQLHLVNTDTLPSSRTSPWLPQATAVRSTQHPHLRVLHPNLPTCQSWDIRGPQGCSRNGVRFPVSPMGCGDSALLNTALPCLNEGSLAEVSSLLASVVEYGTQQGMPRQLWQCGKQNRECWGECGPC